jgi:hypothetical protein
MKKLTVYIFFALLLTSLASCKNEPCFKGSGDDVVERRTLSENIEAISLFDNLKLEVYIDTVNFVELQGGENLLDYIKTDISNKELIIRNENKCSFLRDFDQDIVLKLHITHFNKIKYDGSKNLVMKDTLHIDNFVFESSSGAGDILLLINASEQINISCIEGFSELKIFGKSKNLSIYNDGTGWLKAASLKCKNAWIENKSTGDCIVNAVEKLNCTIKGIGNIQYFGNPDIIITELSGKGRIIQAK